MVTGLLVFHVIVCLLLTVVVLLQFGKGAETGAMMGGTAGSSQNIFSSSSRGNFFTKLTTFLAICFMINSIALTILKSKKENDSILDNEAPVAAPLNSDAADSQQSEEQKASDTPNEAKVQESTETTQKQSSETDANSDSVNNLDSQTTGKHKQVREKVKEVKEQAAAQSN